MLDLNTFVDNPVSDKNDSLVNLSNYFLLAISESKGSTKHIIIPDTKESTIIKAINKVYNSESHFEKYCVNWSNDNGIIKYFDQILWCNVKITTVEINKIILN